MTIIVTGGAGFIGSNFIHKWLDNEEEKLINIDCLTYAGNIENIEKFENNKYYSFFKTRIGNRIEIDKIVSINKPRAIINFAAESHVDRSILGPEEFVKTNVLETLSLLDVTKNYFEKIDAAKKNAFKFIHISTDEVFGSLNKDDEPFKEENQYKPNSPYAASKAASDHLVRAYSETFNLPCITSHCSNNYGPYQYPEKLIPLMIYNAMNLKDLPVYGKGNQIRDWLHVSDHCDAIKVILDKGVISETYNIGGSCEMQNLELVNIVCMKLDELRPSQKIKKYSDLIKFVPDRPGHDIRYAINSSKIREQLKWRPVISFEKGITDTIKWYLKNDEWLNKIRNKSYIDWVDKNYKSR